MRERSAKLLTELLQGPKSFGSLLNVVKNRGTLSLALKGLIGQALIRRAERGYELTEKGWEVAVRLAEISEILGSKSPEVERIPHPAYRGLLKRYCRLLQGRLGARLESVVLFGSVARGSWEKDSDIDLLVVAEGFEDLMKAIDELIEVEVELRKTPEYRRALEEGFYPNLQYYPLSPRELSKTPRILLDAVMDGVTVFDKGLFESVAKKLRDRLIETSSYRKEFPDGRWYWVLGAEEI